MHPAVDPPGRVSAHDSALSAGKNAEDSSFSPVLIPASLRLTLAGVYSTNIGILYFIGSELMIRFIRLAGLLLLALNMRGSVAGGIKK